MEGIRQAAMVHYENAPSFEKDYIKAMFNSIDVDEDGRISKCEFLEHVNKDMPMNHTLWLFTELDWDWSGSLEFNEFITYFYARNSRPVCDCCKELVMGLHYCCVSCWEMHMRDGDGLRQSFQVCEKCYSRKLFQHGHTEFLDNQLLLFRSKEILALKTEKKVVKENENPDVEAALKAGRLFYRALPDKNDAYNLFAIMDHNGDGNVSVTEVIDFLTDKGMPRADASKLFKGTDLGRNGYLSREDVGALWYISVMRPYCARCKARIMGTYYSCSECHNVSILGYDNNTYDLCSECYSKGEFSHEHDLFLDNFALLQIKTLLEPKREKKLKDNPDLKAGYLYYQALSDEEKNAVIRLFAKIDSNGDKKVSVNEVINFLTNEGIPKADACKLFEGTGMTGGCDLNLEDVGALWYIFVTRPSCDQCRTMIMGMYYSCIECHNMSMNGADTDPCDLCPECYSSGDFQHEHNLFLDSFLIRLQNQLLRQGTATSDNVGGSQGTSTSFNGGGQGITTSFRGAGEGTRRKKKLSKREILQILANAAGVGTAAAAVVHFVAAHGAAAAAVGAGAAAATAPVACSIM